MVALFAENLGKVRYGAHGNSSGLMARCVGGLGFQAFGAGTVQRTAAFDVILVGGGLQSGLVALALRHKRPQLRVAMVEARAGLDGNHTWACHGGDLSPEMASLAAPMVVARFAAQEVRFPGLTRVLNEPYAVMSSQAFAQHLDGVFAAAPHWHCLTGVAVTDVRPGAIDLADGQSWQAPIIIDNRGQHGELSAVSGGWQKFVGLELELAREWEQARPILMDATIAQVNAFRFMYTLPLGRQRVLIEDTYFANTPEFDAAALEAGILAYAEKTLGLAIKGIVRREKGLLPMPIGDGFPEPPLTRAAEGVVIRGGYRGGWFHPTTGYSLPLAAKLAEVLASVLPEQPDAAVQALWRSFRRQARYGRLLNRMMFLNFEPARRWNALARFYTLPETTIRNFYACSMRWHDRGRIICGRVPRGFVWRLPALEQAP